MKKLVICFVVAGAFMSQACKKGNEETSPALTQTEQNRNKVLIGYSTLVSATYDDAVITADALQTKLKAFVASPSDQTLDDAKGAWIAARTVYSQTETCRFFIDPKSPIEQIEGAINSWPLSENYIDYVEGDPSAGIINSKTFGVINTETIFAANQNGAEENVACGYHAIEFLLWGQDLSDTGPGERPFTDYVLTADSTHSNPKRRGDYLLAVADLLAQNLNTVANEWKPNASNYRADFVKKGNDALLDILRGMGDYGKGELSGQRMSVALNGNHDDLGNGVNSQEDEQSCFSDQTHNDIYFGQKGIANVYKGNYITVGGFTIDVYSVEDMLKVIDGNLNTTMLANYATTEEAAGLIVINNPFDQLIKFGNTTGNKYVQDTIDALRAQSDALITVALKLTNSNLIIN
ncbi:MAG: imelysin [Cytophagales bacterium]|nr:imelysin [Cytophaga sp.]